VDRGKISSILLNNILDPSRKVGEMEPQDEQQDATTIDTVLLMVHKRIRKRESYNVDSVEIFQALEQNGYPLSEKEVLDSMAELKEARLIRAYEDITDVDPATGKRGPEHVTRYWNIEITPEGVLRANNTMNRYRSS